MHRIRHAIAAAALAAAPAIPLVIAVDPGTAGAICNPGGAAIVASIGAEQARYASTCDGDGFYAGQAYDAVTDGHCVSVRYRNHGTSGAGWIQGQACTTGAFTNYNAQGGPFDVRLCQGTSTTTCTGWFVHYAF